MKRSLLISAGICAAIIVCVFIMRDRQCSDRARNTKSLTRMDWILNRSQDSEQDCSDLESYNVPELVFAKRLRLNNQIESESK